MARRPLLTLAVLGSLLCAPACTKTTGPGAETPQLVAPDTINDLDDYGEARNAYALLAVDDPGRAAARAQLRTYLLAYLDHALASDRTPAAVDALEQLAGLWVPSELRTLAPDPELAAAAAAVYGRTAPAGDERPALLALGLSEAFGDEGQRTKARANYAKLEDWIDRTAEFGNDPRFNDHLDRLLEDVSALLPSPFLVDQLAGVYLGRYRDAQRSGSFSSTSDPRVPFTGYLLARLYLRADDPDAAVAALDRLETDAPTAALRDLIRDAADSSASGRSPADLDQLTREFLPEPDHRLPDEIVRQSWGIIDNLARRSLARFPDHPPAHLALGRVLRSRNLTEAAIVHYEQAFAGKTRATDRDDLHRAWSELSTLYQLALETRAASGASETSAMLERVEAFHERAAQTWPQRAIEPGITLAWMTVAVAEFNAGHIDRAEALMEQTVALEPRSAALSLLGVIAMRRGDFDEARAHLRRLDKLSGALSDQLERYDWQISAHISLAEVEALAGDREASAEQLREALRQLNTLLSYPGLADSLRAEFGLRRARVFFYLGEIELAMNDVRDAQRLAPDRDDAYTEPLIFTVIHGHLDQAAELFAAALARDGGGELGVYYSLWVLDLAERLGAPEPKLAREFLRSYATSDDGDPWQRKLARYGLGQLDDDGLAAAADSPRERSEAFFYEALQRWRGGGHEACLELMTKVLDQQMMGDFEYQMAQSYLRWKELPKTARTAL
ncbi:Tetratricopeptide repeat protein [Enhygromyxa salina]|uniref:Tetratricopeptide repeat protein n=1 Tax=Enhygromyxa salina TaxID=215803 RepID=A0A2S9XDT4_9BACT|nr:tetratricopeptide repeat protein [Enhygromyxa salina]PRP91022.1 Tetratricopeptide repeat protein [Enhygromyxa salina]